MAGTSSAVRAGERRAPHRAPRSRTDGERVYWVRLGAETVDASKAGLLTELVQRAGRVPFDDRRNNQFGIHDLRSTLVREFLSEVKSGLLSSLTTPRSTAHEAVGAGQRNEVPRNVALLFFSDDPEQAFPGARIEVVQFAAAGDVSRSARSAGHSPGRFATASHISAISRRRCGEATRSRGGGRLG